MKKNYFYALIMVVLGAMTSCGVPPLDPEEAAKAVLEGERARIPLYMQDYELTGLTIDSLRLLTDIEPMSALMFTTWTYDVSSYDYTQKPYKKTTSKTRPVVIQVCHIQRLPENLKQIHWYSNWQQVNMNIRRYADD